MNDFTTWEKIVQGGIVVALKLFAYIRGGNDWGTYIKGPEVELHANSRIKVKSFFRTPGEIMVKLVDFSTSDQFGLYQNKPLNGNADQGKCLAQDKTNSKEGLFNLFVDNQQSYLVEFRVNSGLQLELYVDGDLFYDFGVIEDGKKVHLLGQVFQLGGELFLFGYRD